MVAFIHDEVIFELPQDEHLQEKIRQIENLMKSSMSMVITHVKIDVEMAMMTRWYKKAKPQWENGELQIWTPERAGLSMAAAVQGDKEDVRFVSTEDEESEDVEEEK